MISVERSAFTFKVKKMRLSTLEKRAITARQKLQSELNQLFPTGTRFLVKISSRQKRLTPATVIGANYANGLGMVRFRLETKNSRVIEVHYSDVFTLR